MSYQRFERLVIGIGAVVVIGMVAVSLTNGARLADVAAAVMLLVVLVVAVHYGRKLGMYAAVVASAFFVLLLVPEMSAQTGLQLDPILGIAARIGAFGVVGILGGEAAARMQYVLTRLDDNSALDSWSHAYNQRFASIALDRARARYARYGELFSVVVITLSDAITAELSSKRKQAIARAVANLLRGDVRMVDEVARLEDGRFMVLLPHTPREGGLVVTDRLGQGVRQVVGAKPASVTTECFGAAEDAVALSSLAFELAEPYSDLSAYRSGAYNSAADSDLNPADERTSSAPGASTLNMSTAAAPNGSTKQ